MRSAVVWVVLMLGAGVASADPTDEPAPPPADAGVADASPPPADAAAPAPPPPPVAPVVTAVDGDARGFEKAPEPGGVRGGVVFRGIGTGLGWVARVVLFPLRAVIYLDARYDLRDNILNLFVNDAKTFGVYPSLSYSSGFGISYGALAFAKNLAGTGDELSLSARTGGIVREAFQLKYDLPQPGGAPLFVHTRVRFEDNENQLFAGIGNGTETTGAMLDPRTAAVDSRFSQRRFLATLSGGLEIKHPGWRLRAGGTAIYNHRTFGAAGDMATDPSIEQVYNTAAIQGFDQGYDNLELTADVELDGRDHPGEAEHGGIVRAFAGGASLVDDARYAHYGVEGAYFVSPFWARRVFAVRAALEGVHGDDDRIPFTELPRLGGPQLLRGYRLDQFRDKLAAISTLEYHYPIHDNLSGELFVEAGKVARTYSEMGHTADIHVGYGGGLIVRTKTAISFRLDVAYGDGLNIYFSTDVLDAFRNREREL